VEEIGDVEEEIGKEIGDVAALVESELELGDVAGKLGLQTKTVRSAESQTV
jgi:hypothetical protein